MLFIRHDSFLLSHKLTYFLENIIAVRTMKNLTVNVIVSITLRRRLFTVVQISEIAISMKQIQVTK